MIILPPPNIPAIFIRLATSFREKPDEKCSELLVAIIL